MIRTLLTAAALALTVASAHADDKTCRPYGYVTCSFTGWCLNHCGEWVRAARVATEATGH